MQQQLADRQLRHVLDQTAGPEAIQARADDEERHRRRGHGQHLHDLGRHARQTDLEQRQCEADADGDDHRVAQQAQEGIQQGRAQAAAVLPPQFGDGQRQRDHQQVLHQHAEGQGHRRRGTEHHGDYGVADKAAVGHRHAQAAQGAATQVVLAHQQGEQEAAPERQLGADAVGQQVGGVEHLVQGLFQQRADHQRRQGEGDDELAHAEDLFRADQPPTGGQVADADQDEDRAGNSEYREHSGLLRDQFPSPGWAGFKCCNRLRVRAKSMWGLPRHRSSRLASLASSSRVPAS
ncbi:hypothetical protein D9M70_472880 [compost metagenome]